VKNQAVDQLKKKNLGLKKAMQPRQAYRLKKRTSCEPGVATGYNSGFGQSGRDSTISNNQ
jgi:hypothetical protein